MAETMEKPPKDIESDDEEEQTFESLGLDNRLIRALNKKKNSCLDRETPHKTPPLIERSLKLLVAWVPREGWVLDVKAQRLGGGVRLRFQVAR
ncbi:DEAD-box ATP-dependent RNA helicase 16 [Prunus yedoensis var. nudiflora]|uniref:DEAD-box ATP-dependent RNA helicase 16 n=1 Tax=Prunus yedoensis var. nudiflora TaxID=2094558 RepID=A0A314UXA0_PRUYE|nr:DEAD-box ATP-dependent RNA helicase 16 [Prunus yedoensis var. nudiflora]